jgi:hypothetical protein
MTIRPSASCPTPVRGFRASCSTVNCSPALKTGLPSRTRTGPPPIASTTPAARQSGLSRRRNAMAVPTGASARNRCADVPRATSTAPSRGIGVSPFSLIETTGPETSPPVVVGGSGSITASTVPSAAGVAGPQDGVKSVAPFAPGAWLTSIGRRSLVPRHVPNIRSLSTSSVPSEVMPRLERSGFGEWSSTPVRMRVLLGLPSAHAKRSPLTPATV